MKRKPELDEVVRELRSAKEAKGIFVQSSDGHIFFLTDKDAKRTAVPTKHRKTAPES